MAEQKKQDDVTKLSFEQAIDSLTGIVENIESGETELQSSLEQYEKGMAMIKHCRGLLQAAEKRIETVTAEKADKEA
jgi:exodeoxyribonuclease VII small subunit